MRRYTLEREELLRAAVPGTPSARRLARLTDEMLRTLAEESATRLPSRVRWSLVALGGYGSGALLPASDLDLLVISNASAATLKPFVEALLYPLWDAGLSVGHQVRSQREQLAAVRDDLATLTATLTGRVLAGDDSLGLKVLRACAAQAARRPDDALGALRARPRHGSPYLLEPDLKDGAGGRRDFDELTWTAAVLTGAPQSDPGALVTLGLIEPGEFDTLTRAADTVAAARWELQLAGGGSLLAEESAAELTAVGPDAVQRALADTHHLLLRTRRRARGGGPAERGPLSPRELLDLLGGGPAALPTLEHAAWAGRADHLVPGMSGLMTLRRPGIAHTRTVGAHSLACATHAARITTAPRRGGAGPGSGIGAIGTASGGAADGAISGAVARAATSDAALALSARRIGDRDVLLLAALVHDAAKAEAGPGHDERGAAPARAVALRCGFSADRAEAVAALVRHHLLLPATATGADLEDPAVIDGVARTLADPVLVAPLHVLTVADSLATGPGAWSEWHAALVGTLVTRLDTAFAAGGGLPGDDGVLRRPGTPADSATGAVDPAHVAALSDRIAADRTPGAHVVEIGAGPIPGAFRVLIAAADRPGLLATITGVLALAGLDILSARSASTRPDVAVDTFIVTSATLAAVGSETWNRFERLLAAALSDRLAVSVRLAERRRHYSPGARGASTTRGTSDTRGASASMECTIDTEGPCAILHVRAPDRVGLLHDIARAIAESELDVVSLTVTSRAGIAEDTFRLAPSARGGAGGAGGTGALGQLAMRLREL